jgi:hypothetical protein
VFASVFNRNKKYELFFAGAMKKRVSKIEMNSGNTIGYANASLRLW